MEARSIGDAEKVRKAENELEILKANFTIDAEKFNRAENEL